MKKTVAVALALGVAGYAVGLWQGRPAPTQLTSAAAAPLIPRATTCVAAIDETRLRELVGAAVREQLPAAGKSPVTDPAPTLTPVDTAAETETLARGNDLLTSRLAEHQWRPEDQRALMALLPALPQDRREELLSSLHGAFNRGELRPTAPF